MKVSAREQRFLVIGGGIIFVLLFYFYVLEPSTMRVRQLREKIEKGKAVISGMEQKITAKKTLTGEVDALKMQYLKLLSSVKSLREYLITGKKMPDFTEQMQTIINKYKLADMRSSFHTGKDFGVYKEARSSLRFNTSWREFTQFLAEVESSGQMLFIQSMRIMPFRREKDKISIDKLEISGFDFNPEIRKELKIGEDFNTVVSSPDEGGNGTSAENTPVDKPILERDLFQQSGGIGTTPGGTVKIDPSKLNITLRGIVIKGGEFEVLIRDTKGSQESFYKKGDTVNGNLIEDIEQDKVILIFEGTPVELSLHEAEGAPGGGPRPPGSPASVPTAPVRPSAIRRERESGNLPPPPPGMTGTPSPENTAGTPVPRRGVNRVSRLLQADHGIVTRGFDERLAERYQMSGIKGMIVLQLKAGSEVEKAGLRRGDIIMKVNGKDVTQEDEAGAALEQIKTGTDVTLEVKRGANPPETIIFRSEKSVKTIKPETDD